MKTNRLNRGSAARFTLPAIVALATVVQGAVQGGLPPLGYNVAKTQQLSDFWKQINYLKDGGFESQYDATLRSPWSEFSNCTRNLFRVSVENNVWPYTGHNNALVQVVPGKYAGIRQTVTGLPPGHYVLEGYIMSSGGDVDVFVDPIIPGFYGPDESFSLPYVGVPPYIKFSVEFDSYFDHMDVNIDIYVQGGATGQSVRVDALSLRRTGPWNGCHNQIWYPV